MKKGFLIVVAILAAVFFLSFCSSLHLIWGQKRGPDWSSKTIGVIEIEGVIREALPILDQIEKFREHKNLKALVLRIDSPGGAVGASQEIYFELLKLKTERPVVVSMGNLAASGGLYIAVAGTEIVSLPGTITGSMGVMMPLTNISRLMDRLYIDPMPVRSGDLKDAGNPLKPMDEEARAFLQKMVDASFEQFREDVMSARNLSDEAIDYMSDARVISGREALELGVVDSIGNFRDAVDRAVELAGIEKAELAYLSRKPKGFVERLLESSAESLWNRLSQAAWTPYYLGPSAISGAER
ncbi:MAG: signal peptide peptidase SppA [Bradymonadales bacterium]|nr:MAG: signal peptide peptidase SppA [Bradymonadales bacterium]